jgi:hypothetical protein
MGDAWLRPALGFRTVLCGNHLLLGSAQKLHEVRDDHFPESGRR